MPPITEPEETEQKKAEIEEFGRIFEEAKLNAEEKRRISEEAKLNAEEIKREQGHPYAIPDEFDLDEAVRVLRSLLTEEGWKTSRIHRS